MFKLFKKNKEVTRKEKSEAYLTGHSIKINATLPNIEADADVTLRSGTAIAQRIVVMALTNLVAFDNITGNKATAFFKKHDLWDFVTPKEKAFLSEPTPESKNQESWKCECLWVLMWALQVVDDLEFPDHLCNLNAISEEDYPIGTAKDPHDFINKNWTVRPKAEILDAADLYYRLDWACVDARINNRDIETVNPGVVYERHYALNWLINYMGQEWDDVKCDT